MSGSYKEIIMNIDNGETRVAVLENNQLVELYIERSLNQRVAGNIYKGKVENVLPGMQAAFVNIGLERNAFLYVADALPARLNGEDAEPGPETPRGICIGDVLKPKQEVVVQITKEPIGTKGARVTTHLTLPGRNLVLMPNVDYVGVSRRIEDEEERKRLREVAEKIKPPGMGLIVRTVAEGKEAEELYQDIDFLLKLWKKVQNKIKYSPVPGLVYKDLDLVYRIIRDLFSEDVDRLLIDSRLEYEKVLDLLEVISPGLKHRVQLYTKEEPIFDAYGIEAEIEKALNRKVWLKSGGYLVIDQTEALTAIDVNTGKYVGSTSLADTVLNTNLEAAQEIARQLRLRDIGGIIVIDFIDMVSQEHRDRVLQTLEESLKKDRTKANILGLTKLGLVEMTRKKVKQGLDSVLQKDCPYCEGKGKVISEEVMSGKVKREIKRLFRLSPDAEAIFLKVHPSVAAVLIGSGGSQLYRLEEETGKYIFIRGSNDVDLKEIKLICLGGKEEVERRALPVRVGQTLEVKVEDQHLAHPEDGIARIEGYVLDLEGCGKLVGEKVKAEVVKVYRTYAKARVISVIR